MNNMNQSNKPFGMYNSSNPMINGSTKEEINSILESYFNAKSSSIQNEICTIASKELSTMLEEQNKKIADLRESLQDIYANLLCKVDNEEIISVIRANSTLMTNEGMSLKNNIKDYERNVKEYHQCNEEIPNIDVMIQEVDYLIENIKQNAVSIDNDKTFESIDLNNVYNNLSVKLNQISNEAMTSNNRLNNTNPNLNTNTTSSVINKATMLINEAQRKLKMSNGKNNSFTVNNQQQQQQNNPINDIKQFKKRNLF